MVITLQYSNKIEAIDWCGHKHPESHETAIDHSNQAVANGVNTYTFTFLLSSIHLQT